MQNRDGIRLKSSTAVGRFHEHFERETWRPHCHSIWWKNLKAKKQKMCTKWIVFVFSCIRTIPIGLKRLFYLSSISALWWEFKWVLFAIICWRLLKIKRTKLKILNLKRKESERRMKKKHVKSGSIRLDDLCNENEIPNQEMMVCASGWYFFCCYPKVGSLPSELHILFFEFGFFFTCKFI